MQHEAVDWAPAASVSLRDDSRINFPKCKESDDIAQLSTNDPPQSCLAGSTMHIRKNE